MTGDRPGLPIVVDLLHLHRLAAGWSRPALASRAGVGGDTVAAMEHHRSRPRPRTVARLAGVFGPELAGEVHRLAWCRSCARAALAAFVVGTWAVRCDDGVYRLPAARREMVDVGRCYQTDVLVLLAVLDDVLGDRLDRGDRP